MEDLLTVIEGRHIIVGVVPVHTGPAVPRYIGVAEAILTEVVRECCCGALFQSRVFVKV